MGNRFANEVWKTSLPCNHFSLFPTVEGALWFPKDKPSFSLSVRLLSLSLSVWFFFISFTHKESSRSVTLCTSSSSHLPLVWSRTAWSWWSQWDSWTAVWPLLVSQRQTIMANIISILRDASKALQDDDEGGLNTDSTMADLAWCLSNNLSRSMIDEGLITMQLFYGCRL